MRFVLPLLTAAALAAGEPVALDAGPLVVHGRLHGERFWSRTLAVDPQQGGNRLMHLVWTPPKASQLGGTHLEGVPFILLDPSLRVVAWNDRETMSRILPTETGYVVECELHIAEDTGTDQRFEVSKRTLSGPRAWELRLAPMLLALSWRTGSAGRVRLADFFGPRHAESLTLSWQDAVVDLAGTAAAVEADAQGRLLRLRAADGTMLIEIDGR